ncbi:MAG: hypothetical protein JWN03_1107 [Nocardia sp.]|nr:hypothetical protein [Nocardia sp.]
MCNPDDPHSPKVADRTLDVKKLHAAAERDTRTAAQRNHDALLALRFEIDRTKLGSHRGLPIEAIITLRLEDVERGTGHYERSLGPTTEVAYNALHFRLGPAMPETERLTAQLRPEGADMFSLWETLTHADNPHSGSTPLGQWLCLLQDCIHRLFDGEIRTVEPQSDARRGGA